VIVKHQPWVTEATLELMTTEVEWNMWRTKQWPFNDMTNGDTILTVSGGAPGVVMYETKLRNLIKAPYRSHIHAWQLIDCTFPQAVLDGAGVDREWFLNLEYTQHAPASGWLLAWWGQPVRWIGETRPASLTVRPNGWGEVPDGSFPVVSALKQG
jgi:hypothetical protein